MGALYENIKALCDEKGVKPGKMCAEANISKGLITDLKMGRKKTVQIETAKKIANYFDVSVDALLNTETENGISFDNMDLDGPPDVRIFSKQKKKPATKDGLKSTGYEMLTPDNQRMIDNLIEKLLKSQSGE